MSEQKRANTFNPYDLFDLDENQFERGQLDESDFPVDDTQFEEVEAFLQAEELEQEQEEQQDEGPPPAKQPKLDLDTPLLEKERYIQCF